MNDVKCRLRKIAAGVVVAAAAAINLGGVVVRGDESLLIRTPNGIAKKMIVASSEVVLYAEPQENSNKEQIRPFDILFKLRPEKGSQLEEQGEWIRLGDHAGQQVGWVKNVPGKSGASPLLEWNTRFLLDPRTSAGASSAGAGTTSSDPKFTIVLDNGAEVVYRGGSGGRKAIAPILSAEQQQDEYSVAFFLGKTAGGAASASAPVAKEEADIGDVKFEVVFVVDTTSSMTPLITAAKEIVAQVAQELSTGANKEAKSSFRFGLVQYQDSTPGLTPSAVVTPLVDIDTFKAKLAPLSVATAGSEEWNEDVLAGLMTAIKKEGGMNWSEVSAKHIIVLGDAAAHLTGPKNTTNQTIEGVIGLAQNQSGTALEKKMKSISFHSVQAKESDSGSEVSDCRRDFQIIAQNNGETNGYFGEFNVNNPSEKDGIVKKMVDFIKGAASIVTKAQSANIGNIGSLEQEVDKSNPLELSVFEIAKEAIEKRPYSDVEQGKAAERTTDGVRLANRKLLVSKSEIRRIKVMLEVIYTEFEGKTDPGSRGDVKKMLDSLKLTLGALSVGETLTADTPLEKLIEGLPLKSEVLKMSVARLATMQAPDFTGWLKELETTSRNAQNLLDKTDDFTSLTENSSVKEFTYLRFEELP